jgi:hypothetical protein
MDSLQRLLPLVEGQEWSISQLPAVPVGSMRAMVTRIMVAMGPVVPVKRRYLVLGGFIAIEGKSAAAGSMLKVNGA